MQRLLYVTALPAEPLRTGRGLRTAAVLEALRENFDVTLATPEERGVIWIWTTSNRKRTGASWCFPMLRVCRSRPFPHRAGIRRNRFVSYLSAQWIIIRTPTAITGFAVKCCRS
jgi:hypothetical protein